MSPDNNKKALLVLIGSPRRDGNSALMGQAVAEGAREAGIDVSVRFVDDYIAGMLTDTRERIPADDRYGELFIEQFLPAEAVVFCTPVYWYGMSSQMKAFFDRSFTYYSSTFPNTASVREQMLRKRLGLAVVSEETYPGVALGIVHQIQEFARYTHSAFVGYVHGIGNARGEVARDPRNPLAAARALGRDILTMPYSDYRLDTPRSNRVWALDD
jgi:multimeric flavodoxin WrbA